MFRRLALLALPVVIGTAGCGEVDTTSGTTKSPALVTASHATVKHHHPAKPQTFKGSGEENIGTINVPVASTLRWSCSACTQANFIMSNSYNDENQIAVNSLNKTTGVTALDAGIYHDVEVHTEGEDWTIRITPGQ